MAVAKVRAGLVTYLTPSQPLIEENLPDLNAALEECLERQEHRVVIDLNEVPFADSRGLEFLLDARDRVMGIGGSLKLANPNPILNEVLAATRLDCHLEIHFDLEKAGGSFL